MRRANDLSIRDFRSATVTLLVTTARTQLSTHPYTFPTGATATFDPSTNATFWISGIIIDNVSSVTGASQIYYGNINHRRRCTDLAGCAEMRSI
jgi:hypothetical protein